MNEARAAAEARAQTDELTAELEQVKTESGGANVDIVNRHACHVAVAKFWKDFNAASLTGQSRRAGTGAPRDDSVDSPDRAGEPKKIEVDEVVDCESSPGSASTELSTNGDEASDADGHSRAEAMKPALAAARAELEAADDQPPSSMFHSVDPGAPGPTSVPAEPNPVNEPLKITRDLISDSSGDAQAQPITDMTPPPNIDPKTKAKLKLLRRLNPNKSLDELLAKITTEEPEQPPSKNKKKWFFWKSGRAGR